MPQPFLLLFPIPVIRGAASRRRYLFLGRIVVEKASFDRDTVRALKLVLVLGTIVEADDAALLTDPIDALARWQNLIFTRGVLGDGEFNFRITSVGNRGCGSSRGHKKSCDRANRINRKVSTATPAIAA